MLFVQFLQRFIVNLPRLWWAVDGTVSFDKVLRPTWGLPCHQPVFFCIAAVDVAFSDFELAVGFRPASLKTTSWNGTYVTLTTFSYFVGSSYYFISLLNSQQLYRFIGRSQSWLNGLYSDRHSREEDNRFMLFVFVLFLFVPLASDACYNFVPFWLIG